MLNRYDKEERIINDFQYLKRKEIGMYPLNFKNLGLYGCIHNKRKWKNWVDTSAKNELPPDFYNDKLKLMMDVMRIDDHAYVDEKGRVINRHNERESKLIEELISKNKSFKEIVEKGNLFITPDSGLRGYEDHNYNFYVNNFKRVVSKHIKKIEKYKKNHPGFKTIFFIFDESSPYMKLIDCEVPQKPGDLMHGDLHQWWRDGNMLNIIKNSNIDYLIWMTPYKLFNSIGKVRYPLAMIYEVSKIDFNSLMKYEIDELVSMEQ
ncbi:MAG: hypothetical protein ACI4VL_00670 [Bacilli bacterium]